MTSIDEDSVTETMTVKRKTLGDGHAVGSFYWLWIETAALNKPETGASGHRSHDSSQFPSHAHS